jgi:hypothetical protein
MVLTSCSRDEESPTGADPCTLNLVGSFTYVVSGNLTVSTEFGLWMFCEQSLTGDAIADWRGEPLIDQKLLEPINVIWIDFVASDANSAKENVRGYLDKCGFFEDGGFLTLGAFSREGTLATEHEYVSFNEARDKLNRDVEGWSRDGQIIDIGNCFRPQLDCDFTTSTDHDGVRVFVLYDS